MAEEGLIEPSETQEIETQTAAVVRMASDLVVDSQPSFDAAGEFLKNIAGLISAIHEKVDPVVQAANLAHKRATKLRADLLVAPSLARSVISGKMTRWEEEYRKRAVAEERRIREEIQRQEDERRLALAEKAEKLGNGATSKAFLDSIGTEPSRPVTLPSTAQAPRPVPGVGLRDNWTARMKPNGVAALIEAAAKDPRLRTYLLPDIVALNRRAKIDKEMFDIPGFEAFNNRGTTVRSS